MMSQIQNYLIKSGDYSTSYTIGDQDTKHGNYS